MWPDIKTDYERLEEDVFYFLGRNLKSVIPEDCVFDIRRAILVEVLADVVETPAFKEFGTWNDNAIKLAVGHVLMKKLGLKC